MPQDELKTEVVNSRPRNEKGQFIKLPSYNEAKNPAEKFLISHTGNYKDQEDLLDIHIGNPLKKVVELLEEIKKQKAFSFTIKGSLGIAGVVLAVSVFGLFSGDKLLCDKGIQSQTGTVKILGYREIYAKKIPVISQVFDLVSPPQKLIKNRVVLVVDNQVIIHLPYNPDVNMNKFNNRNVIATGTYNGCSRTLVLEDQAGIEEL